MIHEYPMTIKECEIGAEIANYAKQPYCVTRYESVDEAYRIAKYAGATLYRDDWLPIGNKP